MSEQAGGPNLSQNRATAGLKPFVKGQSGNPGGRPSHASLRAALKPHEKETIERLIQHMRGDSTVASMDAITKILAYLYGKPESVQIDDLSTEEILAVLLRRQEQQVARQ